MIKTPAVCLLVILVWVASANVSANPAISEYLKQSQNLLEFQLEDIDAQPGWVEQGEVRINASDDEEYGLAFRFRLKNSAQYNAENRIYSLLEQQSAAVLERQLNDVLYERYLKLLSLIEHASELSYLEAETAISRDYLATIRNLVPTEDFRIADLQTVELEYQRYRQKTEVAKNRIDNQLNSFGAHLRLPLENFLAHWSLNVNQWENFSITGYALLSQLDDHQLQPVADHVEYQLARQELALARGGSSNWLKYVELKLVDRAAGDQETTLGISIPFGGSQFDVSQRVANVNRASMSLQASRVKLSTRVERYISNLDWQQSQLRLLQTGLSLLERQSVDLQSSNQLGILVKLKREILDYRQQLQRNHIRGLRNYIDLLNDVGYLSKQPLVNWLLREQPKL